MAKKPKSSIGFDPLAWMKNNSRESGVASRESTEASQESGVKGSRESTSKTPDSRLPTPGTPCVITLGDTLTIADASERHTEWKGLLAGAAAIEIDASGVQGIDTAGLQLLAALVREAQARNLSLRWRAPTQALRDGAARLGLGPVLHLP